MPTYSMKCEICPHSFDLIAAVERRDEARACPRCGGSTRRLPSFQGFLGRGLARAREAVGTERRPSRDQGADPAPRWVEDRSGFDGLDGRFSIIGNVQDFQVVDSVLPGIDAAGTRGLKIDNSLILDPVALRLHDVEGLELSDVEHYSGPFDLED